jgi:hypothetical protein
MNCNAQIKKAKTPKTKEIGLLLPPKKNDYY